MTDDEIARATTVKLLYHAPSVHTITTHGVCHRSPWIAGQMTLADRLTQARTRCGYSQRTAAKLCGLSNVTISDLESGSTTNPTIGTLRKLAEVYQTSIAELIGE